jgi:hypothetical protein
MFVVLCVAVVLGGYRLGFDQGSATGKELRLLEELHVRTYFVGDLVGARREPTEYGYGGDYDTLINVIQSTIEPTDWDIVGGEGSIQPVARVHSLVVGTTRSVHGEIEDLLAQLRAIAEEQNIDLSQPIPTTRPSIPPFGGGGSTGSPLPETPENDE